jgi:uncharacterized protein YjbJ (UPF0337 family)
MSGTSGKVDEAKGRAKQALGDLAHDKALKLEGEADRAAGSVKDNAEDVEDWVADKIDDVDARSDSAGGRSRSGLLLTAAVVLVLGALLAIIRRGRS